MLKVSHIKFLTHKNILYTFMLIGVVLTMLGIYNALYIVSPDYVQGDFFRILYIHVPCAWFSLSMYILVGIFSILFMIFLNPMYHLIALSIAEVGMWYTLIVLITGAIWGKPTWGTWWIWDARLTSMLFLLFIYMGFLSFSSAFRNEIRAAKVASIFATFGLINIPIIRFSVYIWNTLHQRSTFFNWNNGGFAHKIDPTMVMPFWIIITGIFFWTYSLCGLRLRTRIEIRQIKRRKIWS